MTLRNGRQSDRIRTDTLEITMGAAVRGTHVRSRPTVMAMRMLRNSPRGLTPQNKHILYRACVLPIATYGHRLLYFDGAKVKGVLSSLTSMQRKVVCWITMCSAPPLWGESKA
jgi:hypothetical protein